jgi:hypothetical protein
MRNRVYGVWNLVSELGHDALDFFVIFSSISSLIGTKGASECCAVNQYLDAIGPQLASRGIPASVADLYNNPTVAAQVSFVLKAGQPGHSPAGAPPEDLDDLLDAVSSGAVSPEQAIFDWGGGEREVR